MFPESKRKPWVGCIKKCKYESHRAATHLQGSLSYVVASIQHFLFPWGNKNAKFLLRKILP